MRRLQIILIISITLLFMNMTSFNIYASNKFTTDAKSGIAIDEKSGQIIWEKMINRFYQWDQYLNYYLFMLLKIR